MLYMSIESSVSVLNTTLGCPLQRTGSNGRKGFSSQLRLKSYLLAIMAKPWLWHKAHTCLDLDHAILTLAHGVGSIGMRFLFDGAWKTGSERCKALNAGKFLEKTCLPES